VKRHHMMVDAMHNLEEMMSIISSTGIDQSLIKLYGAELKDIVPTFCDENVDKDAVVATIKAFYESLGEKVEENIKEMCAQCAEFVKGLFENASKLGSSISALIEEKSKIENVDAEAFKEMTTTGYKAADWNKMVGFASKIEDILSAVIAAYDKDGKLDASNNSLTAVVGIKVTDGEVDSLADSISQTTDTVGKLGWANIDEIIKKDAPDVLKIIDKAIEKKLVDMVGSIPAMVEKKAVGDGAVAPGILMDLVSELIYAYGDAAVAMGIQVQAMLNSVQPKVAEPVVVDDKNKTDKAE
jgi:hypothetical protein